MFDIGWSELLVVAIVAIIVVGPKDLPRMLRAFGRIMGQVRRTANEFRSQFDEALRDAELDEARRSVEGIGRIDPLRDVRKELGDIKRTVDKPVDKKPASPASDGADPSPAAAPLESPEGKASVDDKPPVKKSAGKTRKAPKKAKTTPGKASHSVENQDDAA